MVYSRNYLLTGYVNMVGVFHDVTGVWTGDQTNVIISELSAFGVILFWLRYHINANYLIRASEFFYRF